jgi:hypothetical protein
MITKELISCRFDLAYLLLELWVRNDGPGPRRQGIAVPPLFLIFIFTIQLIIGVLGSFVPLIRGNPTFGLFSDCLKAECSTEFNLLLIEFGHAFVQFIAEVDTFGLCCGEILSDLSQDLGQSSLSKLDFVVIINYF